MKKILVTGGAGYLGSMIVTELVNLKFDVTVIDRFDFNSTSLNHLFSFKNFKLIKGDVRNFKLLKKYLKGQNIIIPLAALVGAPLCKKFPKETIETNYNVIKFIIKNINKNQKIIFPTTNSGYGRGAKNKFCDENSPLNPISLYGRTKVDAENIIYEHRNVIIYRLATVFGFSYRMRTDLLVNNFVYRAFHKKKLEIFEPKFRRNYIHIKDVVKAFIFGIENFKVMKGNIYNIGLSSANLTKIMLARKIKKYLKNTKIKIISNKKDPDQRDYYVSNRKIEKIGFKTSYNLDLGIKELIDVFRFSQNFKVRNNY